jgi:hypothetical protein
MSTITLGTRSFFQHASSLKTCFLTCHPLVNTLLNQILSLPTTNFVKKISFFYALVFSFCGLFAVCDSLQRSKLVIAYSETFGSLLPIRLSQFEKLQKTHPNDHKYFAQLYPSIL